MIKEWFLKFKKMLKIKKEFSRKQIFKKYEQES